ncbi:hypothetical protein CEXT_703091 [Caerostris extrusa]|uniref:Uncharacterized protein n=1 Tax=Caerostris extrusa TaxID=172846 RepID=A0AAV4XYW0_CAEEX|nr:hypothetical protein CEXT_703091 [Caerostris extrusa]
MYVTFGFGSVVAIGIFGNVLYFHCGNMSPGTGSFLLKSNKDSNFSSLSLHCAFIFECVDKAPNAALNSGALFAK